MSKLLDGAKNKLGWIKKRVPLDDMQEEYVAFILNEQEKMITLLAAHIYATKANLCTRDVAGAEVFLDAAIADIKRHEGVEPDDTRDDCKHYDEAQGKHYCLNSRCTWAGEKKSCKGVCIYFEK